MNPAEKIWWTKVFISIGVAGFTSVTQVFFDVRGVTLFMLGVMLYLVLSDVMSRVMSVDKFRGLKIGVGAYFFTWLTSWIFLYTVFSPSG